jgi:sortase A
MAPRRSRPLSAHDVLAQPSEIDELVVTSVPIDEPPAVESPAPEPAPPTGGRTDPLVRVAAFLRRRRWARWAVSAVSLGLLVAAVGSLGYPLYTNFYQQRLQNKLDTQLASPKIEEAYRARKVSTGDALTRIKIPAINVDVVVVEGTTASALRAGAGHYPTTPLPCEGGNVSIAGHRVTYGRPFHNLDRLKPGDEITLETPVGSCTYVVERDPFVVLPTDLSVVGPLTGSSLTLTTCHPKGSARQRLVIRATMAGAATPAT